MYRRRLLLHLERQQAVHWERCCLLLSVHWSGIVVESVARFVAWMRFSLCQSVYATSAMTYGLITPTMPS